MDGAPYTLQQEKSQTKTAPESSRLHRSLQFEIASSTLVGGWTHEPPTTNNKFLFSTPVERVEAVLSTYDRLYFWTLFGGF